MGDMGVFAHPQVQPCDGLSQCITPQSIELGSWLPGQVAGEAARAHSKRERREGTLNSRASVGGVCRIGGRGEGGEQRVAGKKNTRVRRERGR